MNTGIIVRDGPKSLLSPLTEANGYALSRDEAVSFGKRIMEMSNADGMMVQMEHRAQTVTRMARSRINTSSTGIKAIIRVHARVGGGTGSAQTDRTDDEGLRSLVARAEEQARISRSGHDWEERFPVEKQFIPSVGLFHERTLEAMPPEARRDAFAMMLNAMQGTDLRAAGFIGVVSSSNLLMNSIGLENFDRWTDTEVTFSTRTSDGTGSGWSGQAHRQWQKIDPAAIARQAIDIAKRSHDPVAVEPGRRTVILSPTAMGQFLIMVMARLMDADRAGGSPFGKRPSGIKFGMQVVDKRVSWVSNPNDPLGGYLPYDTKGVPMQETPWIKDGVLRNMVYYPMFATFSGKPIVSNPISVRMDGGGHHHGRNGRQRQGGVLGQPAKFARIDSPPNPPP